MLGVLEPEWYGMHGVWRGQKHQVMTPCPWVREGEMYMGYCTAASGYGRSLGLRLDSCTCGDEFRGRNGMYGSEIGQSHSASLGIQEIVQIHLDLRDPMGWIWSIILGSMLNVAGP